MGALHDLVSPNGFMPHGHGYVWQPGLLRLHVISDVLIGLAYVAITVTLVLLIRRIRNLPFHWAFVAFGTFIISGGLTHFLDVWTIWAPSHWLSGAVKGVTALASMGTAVLLVLEVPTIVRLSEHRALIRDEARLRTMAEAELQQAVRIRNDFLAIASHELRTPLTSLRLQLSSLLRRTSRGDGLDLPEWARAKLVVSNRQVDRLEALTSELLDVSRLTTGQLKLEPETVDLADLVTEVTTRFRDDLEKAGCVLTLRLDPSVVGHWDRIRLEQVVSNLVSNALKYGAGGPIDCQVTTDRDGAVLSVRDHGIGIAPDDQGRIFERFERTVSHRDYGGFGLGLWLVHQILRAMDGTITLHSQVGEGSTFRVHVPLLTADAPPEPRQGEES